MSPDPRGTLSAMKTGDDGMPDAKVFVAYASRDEDAASILLEGVMRANARPLPVKFEPWPFNDVIGRTLISPILESINDAPYVVADITQFNLNVVYEIGFAIGSQRRVMLVRNGNIEGDKALAQKIGIFDTLGYIEYKDAENLRDILSAHFDATPLPFVQELDKKSPVYLVEPGVAKHADVIISSRVKKAGFKYRSFNPTEHTRMSAIEAIRQVAASSGVICRLQEEATRGSELHNVRACFALGLADGMGKPTLVLSPSQMSAPLDLRDAVKPYRNADDIAQVVADFCPSVIRFMTDQEPPLFETQSPLSSLSVGDPMAENEMTTLASYYLATDQFQRVLNGNANMVVGRKGSGKTALFIRVRDKVRADKRNVVVDLKPEGYQLIKFKEEVLSLLSAGARQHLISAFWEYIILLEVAHKLLEKDQYTYKQDHVIYNEYRELRDLYLQNKIILEGDFSERLYALSGSISDRFLKTHGRSEGQKLTNEQVTELLHSEDIPELRGHISRYLDRKTSVWILFDNLDKGWSIGGVDETDALITRALIDASRKIEREMEKDGHDFKNVIFVRNDVYDAVMRNSSDFGKEMRTVLDWTDPDLLREMLRLRLASGLDIVEKSPGFFDIWQQLCVSHYMGEESSAVMISRTLMRPRNLLKIFNHCRGFASNLNRPRIEEDDMKKGLAAYSEDLFTEIARELEDVMPDASEVLYELMDTPSELSISDLHEYLRPLTIDQKRKETILNFLVFYGVLGLVTSEKKYYIYDVNYDLKRIDVRARALGDEARFEINPALWPALNTYEITRDVGPITDVEPIPDGTAS